MLPRFPGALVQGICSIDIYAIVILLAERYPRDTGVVRDTEVILRRASQEIHQKGDVEVRAVQSRSVVVVVVVAAWQVGGLRSLHLLGERA